jgi:hypothetical protein
MNNKRVWIPAILAVVILTTSASRRRIRNAYQKASSRPFSILALNSRSGRLPFSTH